MNALLSGHVEGGQAERARRADVDGQVYTQLVEATHAQQYEASIEKMKGLILERTDDGANSTADFLISTIQNATCLPTRWKAEAAQNALADLYFSANPSTRCQILRSAHDVCRQLMAEPLTEPQPSAMLLCMAGAAPSPPNGPAHQDSLARALGRQIPHLDTDSLVRRWNARNSELDGEDGTRDANALVNHAAGLQGSAYASADANAVNSPVQFHAVRARGGDAVAAHPPGPEAMRAERIQAAVYADAGHNGGLQPAVASNVAGIPPEEVEWAPIDPRDFADFDNAFLAQAEAAIENDAGAPRDPPQHLQIQDDPLPAVVHPPKLTVSTAEQAQIVKDGLKASRTANAELINTLRAMSSAEIAARAADLQPQQPGSSRELNTKDLQKKLEVDNKLGPQRSEQLAAGVRAR